MSVRPFCSTLTWTTPANQAQLITALQALPAKGVAQAGACS
jgi:hypothetical protein